MSENDSHEKEKSRDELISTIRNYAHRAEHGSAVVKQSLDRRSSRTGIAAGKATKAARKVKLYNHLKGVPDILAEDLACIFIGINPGVQTSKRGHHYAGPGNLFWPLLYESHCVNEKVTYELDTILPSKYQLGLTNLVDRPTAQASELSDQEMLDAVQTLESKIKRFQPKSVCFVGKSIWLAVYTVISGDKQSKRIRTPDNFEWGWQPQLLASTPVYVVPSTSGRVAAYSRAQKLEMWLPLGQFITSHRSSND
ncbi:hypothetical protein CANCADRAFT_121832 [Tortispora caseinolytica NRRL Y-17796]|uniref:Uracil-DNA glycosylase-like domain-containing protein n=1 Tax=Tortispora caseinolytica NRRL Y-17796 TaxID=767744 RepID=A0A1E4THP0_9ASCO|nr:hypothetical protein CANCADRAFT_121832 [Tortispora caseinolytica NRRL Y-17796]